MLESHFIKAFRWFPVNISKLLRAAFFIEHLWWQQMFCSALYFQRDVAEYIVVLHCIIVSFWNLKSLLLLSFVVPLVVIRWTTRCHSLSVVVTRCHSLWRVVIRWHSLPFVVTLVPTRCHELYHSLSFVVTRCHLLSFVASLVVTRCTTVLSFYKRSVSGVL